MVVLDRAPQQAGPLGRTADARDACKHADAEDAAAVVVQLPRELEAGAGLLVGVIDSVGLERKGCELEEHAGLPPRHAYLPCESRALGDERRGGVEVALVSGDRAERPDRLCESPYVAVAFVERLALLDERAGALEVTVAHRMDAEPMQQHG